MTPDILPPVNRQHNDRSRIHIAIHRGLLPKDDRLLAQRQNGSALQVFLLRSHTILFRGQTCAERAVVLGLLRQIKAQSLTDGETERLKLRGARN